MNKNENSKEYIITSQAKEECVDIIGASWTYGNSPQSKLSDASRIFAQMIIMNIDSESDYLLKEALKKIDVSNLINQKRSFLNNHSDNLYNYVMALNLIDDISTKLRIKQAQLLKAQKIYESMINNINDCIDELKIYIRIGEQRLLELNSGEIENVSSILDFSSDIKSFERRVADLKVSLNIANQSIAQIYLIHHNNSLHIEKIVSFINNTVPFWRNQVIMILQLNDIIRLDKVLDKSDHEIIKNEKEIRRLLRKKEESIKPNDLKKLQDSTEKLKALIENLSVINEQSKTDNVALNGIFQGINY